MDDDVGLRRDDRSDRRIAVQYVDDRGLGSERSDLVSLGGAGAGRRTDHGVAALDEKRNEAAPDRSRGPHHKDPHPNDHDAKPTFARS